MTLELTTLALPRPRPFSVFYAHSPQRAAAAFVRAGAEHGMAVVLEPDALGGVWALPDGRTPLIFAPITRSADMARFN